MKSARNLFVIHLVLLGALGLVGCDSTTFMLPGGVELVMVDIPSGTFLMGSTNGGNGERPVHSVTLSSAFQLGRTEVTKAQWEAVMGTRPWSGQTSVLNDPDSPVVYVSQVDAHVFIGRLNSLTDQTFRLPTEAEWEYGCRAGSTTEYYFGDSSVTLSDYAWWAENAENVGEFHAHVVGRLLPNNFGLFDMHGNVDEWCEDWFDLHYYSVSPSTDPTGPTSGSGPVVRGGWWGGTAQYCRSAERAWSYQTNTGSSLGFRLARSSE